jgi:16S rRNA pseudouridine516 synthase
MRLDKFLVNLKYGSRNDIKKLCKNLLIKVNGQTVKDSDININPTTDEIIVNDEIVYYKENITLIMNKPAGCICSTVDEKYPSLLRLLDERYSRFDFNFAGRLDWDTEGLVILSTDGALIHKITSPKKEMYKTYYVKTEKVLNNENILTTPITLLDGKDNKYTTKGAKITKLSDYELLLSITEGKFHQVKRMLEYIDNKVIYLKRVQIGNLILPENLELGKYIEINPNSIF